MFLQLDWFWSTFPGQGLVKFRQIKLPGWGWGNVVLMITINQCLTVGRIGCNTPSPSPSPYRVGDANKITQHAFASSTRPGMHIRPEWCKHKQMRSRSPNPTTHISHVSFVMYYVMWVLKIQRNQWNICWLYLYFVYILCPHGFPSNARVCIKSVSREGVPQLVYPESVYSTNAELSDQAIFLSDQCWGIPPM